MNIKLATILPFLAFVAFGAVSPTIYWGDVPPSKHVSEVASSLTNAIPKSALTMDVQSQLDNVPILTNKMTQIESALDNILGEEIPEGEEEEGSETKKIAMFIIPVNVVDSEQYVGFELKASTNNFSSGTQDQKAIFYSQSEVANTGMSSGSSLVDKMKMYVGTSHDSTDVRAYTRIPNTLQWAHRLYSIVVLVDVTCLIRHPEDNGKWLNEENDDLIWCYCRDRNNDPPYEYESGTTHSLWKPIAPVKWFKRIPNWAN